MSNASQSYKILYKFIDRLVVKTSLSSDPNKERKYALTSFAERPLISEHVFTLSPIEFRRIAEELTRRLAFDRINLTVSFDEHDGPKGAFIVRPTIRVVELPA